MDPPPDPNAPAELTQCQDGVNNDGQTGTDFDGGAAAGGPVDPDGADPQCVGRPWHDRERVRSCGLGFELALLLPLLRRLRRTARAR